MSGLFFSLYLLEFSEEEEEAWTKDQIKGSHKKIFFNQGQGKNKAFDPTLPVELSGPLPFFV